MMKLNPLFPSDLNNEYNGSRVALYVFYALTAVALWRSQHHIFAPDGGAQSIATIPLNAFTSDGRAAVIGLFALWGLSQLIVALFSLLAAIRYRTLIPVLYLMLILEYGTRIWIGANKSIPTLETAPGAAANLPFVVIASLMFVLSMIDRRSVGAKSNAD